MKIFDPKLTGSIEVQSVISGSIVPSVTEVFDIGSAGARWRDLYLSGSTIDLGGTKISRDSTTGDIEFKDGNNQHKRLKVEEILLVSGSVERLLKLKNGNFGIRNHEGQIEQSTLGHIMPETHDLYDLGKPEDQWRNFYLQGNIVVGGTVDGVDIQAMSASVASNLNSLTNLDTTYASDSELTTLSSSINETIGGLTSNYPDLENIPVGIISGSSQIATDISGSITEFSSSVATRFEGLTSDYGELENIPAGIVSESAQLAADISGSITSFSSSIATRVLNNETSLTSINSATSSFLLNTTDTLTGDLTVTGTLTAQEFHTEFVSASILYDSGSTKFGDTSDDTHDFTGSLNVLGDITATGDIAAHTANLTGRIHIANDIYLSGEKVIKNVDTNLYLDSADGRNIFLRPGGTTALSLNSALDATFAGTINAPGGNSTNWNTAFGWGDHSSEGYLTGIVNRVIGTDTDLNFSGANVLSSIALTDGVITGYTNRVLTLANLGYTGATDANKYVLPFTDNSTNWNTAYGWGNHANANYISSIVGPVNGNWWNGGFISVGTDGVMEVGKYLDFHTSNSDGNVDFDLRVTAAPGSLTVGGTIAATGGNSTNWNSAFDWGNHADAGYTGDQDLSPYATITALGDYLPLAGGDMTGQTTHGDSVYSYWGNSNDLQIGHDGSNSFIIDRGVGDLLLYYGDDFVVSKYGSSEVSIRANADSSVELFFDNSRKLQTTSGGIGVTGDVNTSGNANINGGNITINGSYPRFNMYSNDAGEDDWAIINNNGIFGIYNNTAADYAISISETVNTVIINSGKIQLNGTGRITGVDTVSAATDAANKEYVDNAVSGVPIGNYLPLAGGTMTGTNGIIFPDNFNLKIGTGSDLQIYHNGSHSFIDGSSGAGSLYIRPGGGGTIQLETTGGSDMITAGSAAVTLYSSGVAKLATTSAGIYVTGEGYSTAGWGVGTGETPVGKIFNNSGVFNVRAETGRQIAFGNVTNGEAVRIDTVGNVGIGTTNPGVKLDVSDVIRGRNSIRVDAASTGSPYLGLYQNGGEKAYLQYQDSGDKLVLQSDGYFALKTGGETDRITVLGNGNVGIGTTSPSALLTLPGEESNNFKLAFEGPNAGHRTGLSTVDQPDGAALYIGSNSYYNTSGNIVTDDTDTSSVGIALDGWSKNSIAFLTSATGNPIERMRIGSGGDVGIGTTNPAVKLHVHNTGAAARFYSSTNQVPVSIYSNVTNSTLGFKGLNSTNDYNVRVGATGNDFIAYTSNVERLRILSTGNVGIGTTNPGAKLDVQPAADKKVTKFGSDVTSHYYYDTLEDMVMNFTCTSYYQAEVIITAHQTNGGAYCNQYIRGIWSNNHTSHHWDELENVGHLEGSTIAMTVGQDGDTAASGKLTLTFDYSSGSFSGITVRVTDFRNSHAFSIS